VFEKNVFTFAKIPPMPPAMIFATVFLFESMMNWSDEASQKL